MAQKEHVTGRDRFGEFTTLLGLVIYVMAIIFFVFPLSDWIDTFMVVTWVFAPVIAGSLVYARIERADGWDQSNPLK